MMHAHEPCYNICASRALGTCRHKFSKVKPAFLNLILPKPSQKKCITAKNKDMHFLDQDKTPIFQLPPVIYQNIASNFTSKQAIYDAGAI